MGKRILHVPLLEKDMVGRFVHKGRLVFPPFQVTKKEGNEHGKKGDSFGHGGK